METGVPLQRTPLHEETLVQGGRKKASIMTATQAK